AGVSGGPIFANVRSDGEVFAKTRGPPGQHLKLKGLIRQRGARMACCRTAFSLIDPNGVYARSDSASDKGRLSWRVGSGGLLRLRRRRLSSHSVLYGTSNPLPGRSKACGTLQSRTMRTR